MVKVFAANSTDQSFEERVRYRYVGNGFDLFDIQDAKIR